MVYAYLRFFKIIEGTVFETQSAGDRSKESRKDVYTPPEARPRNPRRVDSLVKLGSDVFEFNISSRSIGQVFTALRVDIAHALSASPVS